MRRVLIFGLLLLLAANIFLELNVERIGRHCAKWVGELSQFIKEGCLNLFVLR